MATTDQLRKAERRPAVPPINSFTRDGWLKVIRAMDMARFGEPKENLLWCATKANLRAHVAKRMVGSEPFPPRSAWEVN